MNLTIQINMAPVVDQAVRDVLILNIGELWEDYCIERGIGDELRTEGIVFLEDFANKVNEHGR